MRTRPHSSADQPLVSVIMPAYRMGPFIGQALASVGAQTYPRWEVIVVDDQAPEDGTAAIVADFAKAWPGHRVEFVRHAHNQGVSAARNTGIEHAKGTYIAPLDPDDDWLPVHLERAMDLFARDPELVATSGPVIMFRTDPGRTYAHPMRFPIWKVKHFPHSLAVHNFIQPSATVLRRDAVLEAGGFDTEPALQHIEDYDLWIRLVRAGGRFAFLETPTSRYRKHGAAASADPERMRRLLEHLQQRHRSFIDEGRGRMLWLALDGLEAESHARSGPLLGTLARLDALWARLRRRMTR